MALVNKATKVVLKQAPKRVPVAATKGWWVRGRWYGPGAYLPGNTPPSRKVEVEDNRRLSLGKLSKKALQPKEAYDWIYCRPESGKIVKIIPCLSCKPAEPPGKPVFRRLPGPANPPLMRRIRYRPYRRYGRRYLSSSSPTKKRDATSHTCKKLKTLYFNTKQFVQSDKFTWKQPSKYWCAKNLLTHQYLSTKVSVLQSRHKSGLALMSLALRVHYNLVLRYPITGLPSPPRTLYRRTAVAMVYLRKLMRFCSSYIRPPTEGWAGPVPRHLSEKPRSARSRARDRSHWKNSQLRTRKEEFEEFLKEFKWMCSL